MSGSKMARHTSSIIARPTCGGIKKQGLASRFGVYSSNLAAYNRAPNTGPQGGFSRFCLTDNINTTLRPTQQIGYRSTLGMM